MTDITMCKGNKCELKENCRRFKATPSEFRQSYFLDKPNKTPTDCAYYWPVVEKNC